MRNRPYSINPAKSELQVLQSTASGGDKLGAAVSQLGGSRAEDERGSSVSQANGLLLMPCLSYTQDRSLTTLLEEFQVNMSAFDLRGAILRLLKVASMQLEGPRRMCGGEESLPSGES